MVQKESGVLIIVPHSDDETLFFGGTAASYAFAGIPTKLVVVTDGSKGGNASVFGMMKTQKTLPKVRKEECLQAARRLGIRNVVFLDFPDAGIALVVNQVTLAIQAQIEEFNPSIIYCFDETGLTTHPDHVWTAIAIWKAVTNLFERIYGDGFLSQPLLPFLPPFSLRRLFTVHLPVAKDRLDKWAMINHPSVRMTTIDVTAQIERKRDAAAFYRTQKRIIDHFNKAGLLDLPSENFIKRLVIEELRLYSLPIPVEAKYINSSSFSALG